MLNRWRIWLLNIQRQIFLTHSGQEQVQQYIRHKQKRGRYGTNNCDCYLKSNPIFGYDSLPFYEMHQIKTLLMNRKHGSLHSHYPLPVFLNYTEHNPHRENTTRPLPGNALGSSVGPVLVIRQIVQAFILWCK